MIEFLDMDADKMEAAGLELIEEKLGRKIQAADPLFLYFKSLLAIILQQKALIQDLANQNLLKYARGGNLEALGELVGVQRLPAAYATVTMELTLSIARIKETVIPAGTRFNADRQINFALDEDLIFLSGETVKRASATCLEIGEVGNFYKVGEINKIVDPAAFLQSAENVTESDGGAEIETDDALRERIRQAPNSFSVAGSKQSYEFWTKAYSAEIIDALAVTPAPGYVDVFFLTKGGNVPTYELIQHVQDFLSSEKIRPLTDFVTVKPPEIIEYQIDVDYWISRSDQTQALSIKNAVENAVAEFEAWTRAKLGRDVNPTELYFQMRKAQCKRAVIRLPEFLATPDNSICVASAVNINYRGLEDE